jgi:hypothetical protein
MNRIGQAVESYQIREGRYPHDLNQLLPRYLLSIPGPDVIRGQDWCYQAGEDGFQLAHLERGHGNLPTLSARPYHLDSHPADLHQLCADHVNIQQQREPLTYWQMHQQSVNCLLIVRRGVL